MTRQVLSGSRLSAPVQLAGSIPPRRNHHEVLFVGNHLLEVDGEEHYFVRRLEGDRVGPAREVGACCGGSLAFERNNTHVRHYAVGSTILVVSTRGRIFGQTLRAEGGLDRCGSGVTGPEALRYPANVRGAPDFDFADRQTHFAVLSGRLVVVRRDGEVHAVPRSVAAR